MLETGQKAPDFTLKDTNGDAITLSKYEGKNVVLYFYPKDMTPGCTTEACDFRDQNDLFKEINTVVFGVSPDSVESHQKFTDKHELPFQLLADPDHEVSEKYGVWQLKKNFGKEYMGIQRTTYVIDQNGNVAKVWPKVKVDGHVDDVLAFVKDSLS